MIEFVAVRRRAFCHVVFAFPAGSFLLLLLITNRLFCVFVVVHCVDLLVVFVIRVHVYDVVVRVFPAFLNHYCFVLIRSRFFLVADLLLLFFLDFLCLRLMLLLFALLIVEEDRGGTRLLAFIGLATRAFRNLRLFPLFATTFLFLFDEGFLVEQFLVFVVKIGCRLIVFVIVVLHLFLIVVEVIVVVSGVVIIRGGGRLFLVVAHPLLRAEVRALLLADEADGETELAVLARIVQVDELLESVLVQVLLVGFHCLVARLWALAIHPAFVHLRLACLVERAFAEALAVQRALWSFTVVAQFLQ